MSLPNKSLDKTKRYAGFKANDFVNKTRANEPNRSTVRPQGWANLGKINSRRVPPPANLPSLKSETDVNSPKTPNYGWTTNENPTSMNSQFNPTQQQLDSLPVNFSTPPSSSDVDKPRVPPTWSAITAGTTANSNEQTPNISTLHDFPCLATTQNPKSQSELITQDRKSQSESITNIQNPTFRPANLATWKEGGGMRIQSLSNDLAIWKEGSGGTRIQPLSNDLSQILPTNPGANLYQQQNMRMYPPQMWTYNPYTPVPLTTMHQQQQRVNATLNEYKSPTILRNKDIDDLSKITDNTWANTSQEVNYEEKIRFSDDEDILDSNIKTHRINNQVLKHTRLLQDDEHLKQMQDNKNSELINALTIAKQRRDEQERNLKNEQLISNNDEQKQIPGYQTRPLLTSNEQENYNSSSYTSRTRRDTPNSQTSFTMKSWSDQMDSFNYEALHEKSTGHMNNDEYLESNQYSRSQSETSSQSPHDNELISKKSKMPPPPPPPSGKKQQTKNSLKKSNDQWEKRNESRVDNRSRQQLNSNDSSIQKANRYNKQPIHHNDRQQITSRSKQTSSLNDKPEASWRPLSLIQTSESIEPTSQETVSYKSQQRYQTINTASIPPLMSVRSDATTTSKLYKTPNHTSSLDYYDDNSAYYESNLQTNQRYHNRGYTALGSYGRYRRSGTLRHQQQSTTYHINHPSNVSSAPNSSSGTRQKKNSANKKTSSVVNEINSSVGKNQPTTNEEVPITKPIDTSVLSPTIEIEKSNDSGNIISDPKPLIKPENESNIVSQTDNQSIKPNQKNPPTSTNSKRRTNKDQQNYQHYQQAPRHRNNYSRTMQDYETMQMPTTVSYYGTTRRTAHSGRMHDLSSGYYYEQFQQHYNNQYNYSNEHYQQQQQQQRSKNKNSKRGNNRQQKQQIINGSNNNNNNNRHHSVSDNDQKEGEEWETASESSTNMRNGHYDNSGINNQRINETKTINHGKTPPKKSFSSQRPNARQIFKYTNA